MKILIFVMLALIAGEGVAHSFKLGFVVPMSGTEREIGRQALDGFMLATTEQDAHLFEESDGHLGGLDSYVIIIDSSVGESSALEKVEDLVVGKRPLFVTGIFSAEMATQISQSLQKTGAVLVNPVDSAMWRRSLDTPESLTTMIGGSFDDAFNKTYGYAPTNSVRQGYIAARLIASTVRSLPESQLEDRDELARALSWIQ